MSYHSHCHTENIALSVLNASLVRNVARNAEIYDDTVLHCVVRHVYPFDNKEPSPVMKDLGTLFEPFREIG